jgi:hypothetical protein
MKIEVSYCRRDRQVRGGTRDDESLAGNLGHLVEIKESSTLTTIGVDTFIYSNVEE